jgi:hypothetical protein
MAMLFMLIDSMAYSIGAVSPLMMIQAQTATNQPSDQLVQQARSRLARHLNVAESTLTLRGSQAREWPNSALGCSKPGAAYLDVVSSGFLLTFDGADRSYAIHTDAQGRTIVLCESNTPLELSADGAPSERAKAPVPAVPPPPGPRMPPVVTRARESLARDLAIDVDDVNVIEVRPMEWRDSALGCPRPGMSYMQLTIQGYLVRLEAQGKRYEYHTELQRTSCAASRN